MRVALEPVGSRRRAADNRRRLADVVRETLLNLAAIGGAICILLTLSAVFFEDPAPHTVSKVRTVLYSVPGIAYVVAGASSPWVLGGTTVAVSGLVTWALWPRPESTSRRAGTRAVATAEGIAFARDQGGD